MDYLFIGGFVIFCLWAFFSQSPENRRQLCWCFIGLTIVVVILMFADPSMRNQILGAGSLTGK